MTLALTLIWWPFLRVSSTLRITYATFNMFCFKHNKIIQHSKWKCHGLIRDHREILLVSTTLTPPLWTDLVKILTTKPSYSSFFSAWSRTAPVAVLGLMHWFRKCNFWKNSLSPFWCRRGCRGQTTSKPKKTKIPNENL